MERLTCMHAEDAYYIDDTMIVRDDKGFSGEAINRLARFENFYEELLASQAQIPAELEKLRGQGQEKTVRFKELLAKKMINASIIDLFKSYGLH